MLKRNLALWLSILLTLVIIFLSFIKFGPTESLELTTYDWRMRSRASSPETRTDIAVVDIDDDSILKLGRWPWPRALIARTIEKLHQAGASLIGLNVVFSEPEIGEGLKLVERLTEEFFVDFRVNSDPRARKFLNRLKAAQDSLDNDKKLAEAISGSGNVTLPVIFTPKLYQKTDLDLPDVLVRNGLPFIQGRVLDYVIPANKVLAPIDKFSEKALGLGSVNVFPDTDGAVRREVLVLNYKGLVFPSLALKLAMLAQGVSSDQVKAPSAAEGADGLFVGKQFIPTNPNLDFFITFTDPQAFPRVSFFDVLNDKVASSTFKDKIVLIGVSAVGVDIPQVTPVDKRMPSFMVAANALNNLLEGNFMIRSGMMDLIEIGILALIGVFLAVLLPRLKARAGALISLGLLVAVVAAGWYLFVFPGIWFKTTYPVLLIILGYASVTTTRYFVTEAGKDKAEGESAEVNRMLGLSFQNQGQLDLAFDKFRRVPVDDGMKEILFNLGLDYERKRMLNKAVSVYEYIRDHDPDFRDIQAKIKKLNVASETMIYGLGPGGTRAEDGTLVLDEDTKPTLGRYEIMKELGKGAMGIVYLGKDPKIGRTMAIKTIRFTDEYEEDEAVRLKEQFFREAETAGMLSHPHIVTIFDAGEDRELSYIAMEFLEGYDLKQHAAKGNLLPIREVLQIVADVADALGYAHSRGVVHRDIKPANIMYLKNGIAKVTDFGIARAVASSKTKTGVVKGTPFYMSPEQITGKKVDGRSDIYSLGVVLYELLTGVQPFRAEDLTGLIYKITNEDPDPVSDHNPRVPKAVQQIIEKAMLKDRDKRYQKAEQLAEHLRIVIRKMDELAIKKQTRA